MNHDLDLINFRRHGNGAVPVLLPKSFPVAQQALPSQSPPSAEGGLLPKARIPRRPAIGGSHLEHLIRVECLLVHTAIKLD